MTVVRCFLRTGTVLQVVLECRRTNAHKNEPKTSRKITKDHRFPGQVVGRSLNGRTSKSASGLPKSGPRFHIEVFRIRIRPKSCPESQCPTGRRVGGVQPEIIDFGLVSGPTRPRECLRKAPPSICTRFQPGIQILKRRNALSVGESIRAHWLTHCRPLWHEGLLNNGVTLLLR